MFSPSRDANAMNYTVVGVVCRVFFLHAQATPLDSETGWTRELWSKTNLLKWQN